ncbi:MAG: hypothetical protein A2Z99_05225 [Treponema sp. GWB1_62_6]|nr:MAG: hypothetical protein A2Z99_05225 [Treponema sp. GWB1_62_6]OHE70280.1 MAG: hypothetical protein A2001_05175 [Treponema sp. GWC1_61_84]HCM26849.1 hypothetical protein [Treponema sp.]
MHSRAESGRSALWAGLSGRGGFKRSLLASFAALFACVFFIAWIVHLRGYREAILKTADELTLSYASQISGKLGQYLDGPLSLVKSNKVLFSTVPEMDIGRIPDLFAVDLAAFEAADIISVGFADGEYAEAQRLADGTIRRGRSGVRTGGALSMYRFDAAGRIVEESRREGYDPRLRPWYLNATEHGSLTFSEPYSYVSTGERAIAAIEPLYFPDGTLRGVTSVTIRLSYLQDFITSLTSAFAGHSAILDEKGAVIAASSAESPFSPEMMGEKSGIPLRTSWAGKKWRLVVLEYDGKAEMEWKIAVALPEERFLAPMAKMRLQIGGVYALALLAFIALSFLIIRSLAEPLRMLGDAVSSLKDDLGSGRSPARRERDLLAVIAGRRDEMGQLAGAFSRLSEDLTGSFHSLKQSVAEKEILLKEVHHRVKNNLQVISSLLSLRADDAVDSAARVSLEDMQERVFAMALVHEVIYSSGEFSAVPMDDYVSRLGGSLSAFDRSPNGIELIIKADKVVLPLERAIPCALVIVELVSNAFKYAFTDRQRGQVAVTLSRIGEELELSVQDDGIGIHSASSSGGTGTVIVKALTDQLEGSILTVTGQQGTNITVRFPLISAK